jgi:hypothetical protein
LIEDELSALQTIHGDTQAAPSNTIVGEGERGSPYETRSSRAVEVQRFCCLCGTERSGNEDAFVRRSPATTTKSSCFDALSNPLSTACWGSFRA